MALCLPLVLASQSPRRASLLVEAGIAFEQRSPPYADPDQPPVDLSGDQAESYARSLAERKAFSLAEAIENDALILSADTICVDHDGRLLGKPIDREDAGAMLDCFCVHAHRVITGVALVSRAGEHRSTVAAFADTALVRFGPIDPGALDRYLQGEDWRGKAGGYNLFDRLADGWPIEVVGDPTTVVGLPMKRLVDVLASST